MTQTKPITRKEYDKDQNDMYGWITIFSILFIGLFSWMVYIETRVDQKITDNLINDVSVIQDEIWEDSSLFWEPPIKERLAVNEQRIVELNQGDTRKENNEYWWMEYEKSPYEQEQEYKKKMICIEKGWEYSEYSNTCEKDLWLNACGEKGNPCTITIYKFIN